jgi:hypothetical protein
VVTAEQIQVAILGVRLMADIVVMAIVLILFCGYLSARLRGDGRMWQPQPKELRKPARHFLLRRDPNGKAQPRVVGGDDE